MVEASLSSTFDSSQRTALEQQNDTNTTKDATKKPLSLDVLFQDAITVTIPLDTTVDLGVAIRRTRSKRIDGLYKAFPSLKPVKDSEKEDDDDDEEEEDEGAESSDAMDVSGEGGETADKKSKKKAPKEKKPDDANNNTNKSLDLVPQRHEFGSIMDYLEAKYVRGVMIQAESDADDKDKEEGGKEGETEEPAKKKAKTDADDEGEGSVYSESSFLDDRDLQRDIAEQVLAQTTTTKVELEGDDDFFVNVGDLVVEETELTHQQYDPLDDSPKKPKASKKRKKPTAPTASTTAASKSSDGNKASSPPAKKKAVVAKKKKVDESAKKGGEEKPKKKVEKKKSKEASPKPEATPKAKEPEKDEDDSDDGSSEEGAPAAVAAAKKVTKKNSDETKALKAKATKYRKIMESRFATVKRMIKELSKEQLPRRPPLKSKVTITCPPTKKEGDEVTFANPHIPGQRLKVQVPKGTFAGETFKVTVPVPKPGPGDEDEGVDHNKFPRDLQDELDMYAREYDDFCKHEGEFRHAKNEEYPIHLEKRKKYDQVCNVFPKNLMTKIDADYMKKLVRRARQNKSKRSKTAAVRRSSGDAGVASPDKPASSSSPGTKEQPGASDQEQADAVENSEEEQPPPPPQHRTLDVPSRGLAFPAQQFCMTDFHNATLPHVA